MALIRNGGSKNRLPWRFSPSAGAAAICGARLGRCCVLLPVVAPGRLRSRRGGWQESSRPPGTSPRRELAEERLSCTSPSAASWSFSPLATGGRLGSGLRLASSRWSWRVAFGLVRCLACRARPDTFCPPRRAGCGPRRALLPTFRFPRTLGPEAEEFCSGSPLEGSACSTVQRIGFVFSRSGVYEGETRPLFAPLRFW